MSKLQVLVIISLLITVMLMVPAALYNHIVWAEAHPLPKELFQGGGPKHLSPGAPVPSCNANGHQGPPDDDIRGCFETPSKP
jgi:hypothetical protein